ncbi:MAG: hypothetical protein K2X91_04545, partial [Thermoleophilia bacterium]|nr:hypothetical protein [Thermoleophilia bacterium]
MTRRTAILAATLACLSAAPARPDGDDGPAEWSLHRPEVAGLLRVNLRIRQKDADRLRAVERAEDWKASETAIVVIDMWDDIYCKASARRLGVLAPRVNAVLSDARDRGILVIHAPSGTMDLYAGSPQRLRLQRSPKSNPPVPIAAWCDADPDRGAPPAPRHEIVPQGRPGGP